MAAFPGDGESGDPSARARTLGGFLRAHRERMQQGGAGLGPGGPGRRRRTPGLRREEVAHMAGVSLTWYARIEQGRAPAVSAHALGRLADVLRLSRAERAHLFALAERHDPAAGGVSAGALVPDGLRRSVEGFAGPAYVMDGHWTVRACNPAAERLFGSWMREGEGNLMRFVFLSEAARRLIVDWEDRARRLLAEFRLDHGRRMQDGAMLALVGELRAGSDPFRNWWDEQHVMDREGGRRCFVHDADGLVTFDQITLLSVDDHGYKLVLLLPV